MSTAAGTPYVLTFGETMALIKADTPGPLAHATSMSPGMGGSESNVAIGLQRLGTSAQWCGRVGNDALGELVLREIRAEGVQVHATLDHGAPTGLMIKERRTAALQNVIYYRKGSAGSRLSSTDVPEQLITGAALVHISGITPALSDQAAATVHYAIAAARAAGVPISLDLNYRRALWNAEDAAAAYQKLIPLVDIVFAGDDEATIAVGEAPGPAALAQRIAALGPSQVIIKLGSEGAVAIINGGHYSQRPIAIDALDTVGAGDAFVAGYLAELVAGKTPEERLLTAAQTGAFACLVSGDWEGAPRRSELGLLGGKEPVSR
ncbi:sugar kinase [Arthrobacter psychrolactophilus]|uniref:Sugar kinase n=1 Tax=Arthrobacter psychrolactophilus TaxID=92442 RepID=A0A2V5IT80_9MICC|nr:sugar kinase [Arthrobacter psychrolactophilus]PYI39739.1 sugar kinase [Arthrobacter psychrolactophilus]